MPLVFNFFFFPIALDESDIQILKTYVSSFIEHKASWLYCEPNHTLH